MRITPAEVAFDGNGTPFSPAYGDVYHSADSGPGQAQHVFLGGNDLPAAWRGARTFTILETGFGLGLNFLATWRLWRDDPARCERLHYVSIEKHPFDRDALVQLHRQYPEFASLGEALQSAWPPLVPGLHRLHFESERLTLTLAFGDAAEVLPRLHLVADAIYLDGFAPQRNVEMWSPRLMKGLARLARPGATLATWSIAASVRQGLEAAGFTLEKRPGFGHKREMLAGRFAPRWPVRHAIARVYAPANRHAIVVGAGLAGAAVCERLAARGWRVDLIERGPPFPDRPRSRFAGLFHPHVSRDDAIRSRVARNGFLYALRGWAALEQQGHRLEWDRCGVLQLPRAALQERSMAEAAASLDYPAEYAQFIERERAQSVSGVPLRSGGLWFPCGGWMRPASLIDAQLAAAGPSLAVHFGVTVDTIARGGDGWHALAADGSAIATAPIVVLANSHDVVRLASIAQPLDRIRGQVTYVPAEALTAPRTVLAGAAYVLPAADGIVVTGSTYDRDDENPEARTRGHEANLARLAQVLPHAADAVDANAVDGAVGFRCVAPDRMPLAGALPDVDDARRRTRELSGAHLADLQRVPGLYCVSGFASRGLVWAALAGEIVASSIEGEPLPLESDLADALDPARFVLRQVRAGTLY